VHTGQFYSQPAFAQQHTVVDEPEFFPEDAHEFLSYNAFIFNDDNKNGLKPFIVSIFPFRMTHSDFGTLPLCLFVTQKLFLLSFFFYL
jgi:hypothetical protein